MRMPAFTAEVALCRTGNVYGGRAAALATGGAAVIPAAPYCGNCWYVCWQCYRYGRVCGGCALCEAGICDPTLDWAS